MTQMAGGTNPGRCRASNEDTFLADADLQLLVVADGMGGHRSGEVASRLAVDAVAEFVRSSETDRQITWPFGLNVGLSFEANQLQNAVRLANQRVRLEALQDPDRAGMGSTIVAVRIRGGRLVHCNVGDSRLYLYRDGVLSQLSTDHSWAASMIRAGASPESLEGHPMRHVLTRALGTEDALDVTVRAADVQADDLLLLCTDGLHGAVGDQQIARILKARSGGLESAVQELIDAAIAAGGPDNVTVVLASYQASRKEEGANEAGELRVGSGRGASAAGRQ